MVVVDRLAVKTCQSAAMLSKRVLARVGAKLEIKRVEAFDPTEERREGRWRDDEDLGEVHAGFQHGGEGPQCGALLGGYVLRDAVAVAVAVEAVVASWRASGVGAVKLLPA